MYDHFYTISESERDSAVGGAYELEGTTGFVFPAPDVGPVPLYRALNLSNGDHFYTTSDAEYANALKSYGYRGEGTAGFIYGTSDIDTLPFFRLFAPSSGDHFYTTSPFERDNALTNGYRDEGFIGYVRSNANRGDEPFYRSYNPNNGDHFYTMSAAEHTNAVTNLGYVNENIACYLQRSSALRRVPLFRCFKPDNGDHFYTTSQSERDSALNDAGYEAEGIACYVYTDATGGAQPLYRLFQPDSGDHFYTMSVAERDNALTLGYIREIDACFLFASAVAGTVPLFRLLRAYDAFVDVNLIAVSGDTWTVAQWNSFTAGFAGAAQLYRQVGIRLRDAGHFDILAASAGGYPTIDSDSEAESLTDDWTVPNVAIDLFCVPLYVGTVAGLSPVDGPCDKNAKGMDGSVVERTAPLNVIIAHELGHYLGLEHNSGAANVMNGTAAAGNTVLSSGQGASIKDHCFVRWY
jgi:hypothetical protein